ncbi:MAG: MBL fold metallo-hydrolase [Prevotella sp.]|jgi:L-ascorbate metabolism protein UlaG (beta-lactamase superfamily)|nr:MBL fold metallo-hydrolase [Prevotella sp.]
MKKIHIILLATLMMTTACAQKTSKDTFYTHSGKKVVLTAIKHASIEINYNGLEIEVDPVGELAPETNYRHFPKADFILITHEHNDHLDAQAVAELEKKGTVIVTNQNSERILGKGEVMKNGDHLQLAPDIQLDAVPAYNITPGHTQYHPKGRDNGFILTLDGLRIYIAGDTEDIKEMENVKDIDIAFLPTNQPFTMTPAQTVKVARLIRPKVLFPYHYSDTKIDEVSRQLKGSGIDVRIRNYQ